MIAKLNKSWIDIYREDPVKAWQNFIESYDKLIKHVIQKLVRDYDEIMELYATALEQLKAKNYQKLTVYFEKKRNYNFETWIAVVVRNCCMDWFRKEKGRTRLLKCIEELAPLDKVIFKYIYQYGYSQQETFELLNAEHGYDISTEELCSRINQIKLILHQKTRWKLENEWKRFLPAISIDSHEDGNYHELPVQNDPDPEENYFQNHTRKAIQETFKSLPVRDQLIIHLYYYKGLTLEKIARLLKMKNIWQVHRKLHKTLKFLQKELQKKDIDPSDL